MSFNKALNFPFSNNNLNKILQIGLVFGLIYAAEVVLNGGRSSGIGTFVGFIGGLLFAFFVSGYGIIVMQHIMRNDERLPEFDIADSISRGFKVFLASLVYFIPLFIVMACAVAIFFAMIGPQVDAVFQEIIRGIENPGYVSDMNNVQAESNAMLPMLFCGALLLFIPATFILGYAAQIGMARFAAEDRSGALYEFGTNIGMVFKNAGAVFKLFLQQLVIGVIYFFVSMILGFVAALFIGGSISSNVSIFAIAVLVVVNIISTILSTAQQMSNLHLITNFAFELGIVKGKWKNDGIVDAYEF